MRAEWRRIPLGDVLKVEHGFAFRGAAMAPAEPDDPIVVSIGNFRYDGGFRFESTTRRTYIETFDERYVLNPGDICLAMTCQTPGGEILGIPARVPRDGRTYLHNQRIGRVRVIEPQRVDEAFLFWLFATPGFNRELCVTASGSKILHTSPSRIEAVPVDVPSLMEQQAIASVLTTLDDRIESNRRVAEAARTVLVASAPTDGVGRSLDSVAAFRNGGALTKHATGDGMPVLRIKELKAGVTDDTPRTSVNVKPQHDVAPGDLLFSWSGTLLVHRWTGGSAVLNQHLFRVDPHPGYPRWLVEAWIEQHLPEFRRIAADKATTMGHIQRHHLAEASILIPKAEVLTALRDRFDPVDQLRIGLLVEGRTLTAIRDALLPKLVSGQIRVPLSDDPEEGIGAAVNALDAAPA